MEIDSSPTVDLVNALRTESFTFKRQWFNWLGLGGGGGIVALLSFAANLPQPDHALKVIWPALAAFTVTVFSAGITLLLASQEAVERAEHFAHAHNRDEYQRAAEGLPLIIAAPQELADRSNVERNHRLKISKREGVIADRAWTKYLRWRFARRTAIALACGGFVLGSCYPLFIVLAGIPLAPISQQLVKKSP